jgi:hypothetical protein
VKTTEAATEADDGLVRIGCKPLLDFDVGSASKRASGGKVDPLGTRRYMPQGRLPNVDVKDGVWIVWENL